MQCCWRKTKLILHETVCGLFWVIRSWFLERGVAVYFFKLMHLYIFWCNTNKVQSTSIILRVSLTSPQLIYPVGWTVQDDCSADVCATKYIGNCFLSTEVLIWKLFITNRTTQPWQCAAHCFQSHSINCFNKSQLWKWQRVLATNRTVWYNKPTSCGSYKKTETLWWRAEWQ